MHSIAWANYDETKWLKVTERQTHAGIKKLLAWTTDINEAYTGYINGPVVMQMELHAVEVVVKTIVERADDVECLHESEEGYWQ